MNRNRLARLLGWAAAIGVASCFPIYFWNLDVEWAVEGSTAPSLCAKYGVYEWEIEANGPEHRTRTVSCGNWNTGSMFYSIEEGWYTVTMRAKAANGSVIGTPKSQEVEVAEVRLGQHALASFNFSPSDLTTTTPPGKARLEVYWNINGTEDGTDLGYSWDKCNEVGAAKAVITIDGSEKSYECSQGSNMGLSFTVDEGSHTVIVKLADQSGTAITTESKGSVTAKNSTPGQFIADFYYFSFLGTTRTGTQGQYWFATSFENGKACADTTPRVGNTLAALYTHKDAGGNPVITRICGPDSQCYKTDGASYGPCYGKDQTQKIDPVTWGLYRLTIQGATGSGSSGAVCWEKTKFDDMPDVGHVTGATEILVGAGTVNPVRKIDLPRISNSPPCK